MATPSGATQAQGTTLEVQNSGGSYVFVGEVMSLNQAGNNTTIMDATALEHSFEQRFKSRVIRKGEFSGSCNLLPGDSGQERMQTLSDAADKGQFRVVFPAPLSQTYTFPGLVTSWSLTGVEVDEMLTAEFEILITDENITIT